MNGFTMPPRGDLRWVAIDLDGTIAEPLWRPDNPTAAIGDPIRVNAVKVRELSRAGWKPVIHTSRGYESYEAIESWLIKNDIPFRSIVCGKLLAAAYLDDRNIDIRSASWLPR